MTHSGRHSMRVYYRNPRGLVRWGRTRISGDVQTVTEATGQTTLARLASLYTGTVATAAGFVTSATVYHLPSHAR